VSAPAATTVRVAACQLSLSIGDVEGNRRQASAAVEDAAAAGARLVVLPELTPSGYVFTDETEARSLAEPLDGETVREWSELAGRHDVVVVGGICELGPEGELRNSAVLVDASGLRATYRKTHLWDRESDVFVPGGDQPPVVDTAAGRVGLLVCYDLEFPEWVRRPAVAGAEVIAAPTNWPTESRPAGERPMEVVRVQAGAAVNRVYVVAADRCGRERGVDWVGGSVIVGPDGYPLAGPAAADTPQLLVADIDLRAARSKVVGTRNDVFADRRPDLYT